MGSEIFDPLKTQGRDMGMGRGLKNSPENVYKINFYMVQFGQNFEEKLEIINIESMESQVSVELWKWESDEDQIKKVGVKTSLVPPAIPALVI